MGCACDSPLGKKMKSTNFSAVFFCMLLTFSGAEHKGLFIISPELSDNLVLIEGFGQERL
jgi:hypothetical protein